MFERAKIAKINLFLPLVYTVNFFESLAIATETQDSKSVSTEEISIPLEWVTGSLLTVIVAIVSFVWWVGKLSAKVESSGKMIEEFHAKSEKERDENKNYRKELKEDLQDSFRVDITQSTTDICHRFELFAMDFKQQIKELSDGLVDRDLTVNRLGKKVDQISNKMIEVEKQIQNQDLAAYYRQQREKKARPQSFEFDPD